MHITFSYRLHRDNFIVYILDQDGHNKYMSTLNLNNFEDGIL